ncbi:hypothetical protein [Streptomyces sp. NPDC014734]|uniref:hypothetical protein n=1 Tax=Streptomyces sp. NPDC014734 TaxID=3364886 RepID=UPI0036FD15BA
MNMLWACTHMCRNPRDACPTRAEGVETRCAHVAAACGLDGGRLHAWSQVIAPFAAIAHLGDGGEEPVIDELLALTR